MAVQGLRSDDVTVPSSAGDNNVDNTDSLEDAGPSQSTGLTSTDVTDADLAAAAAAAGADDHEDDVVARSLQKRQSVLSLLLLYTAQSLLNDNNNE